MENTRVRQSNIELLRIIATLFILIVHCNGWFINDLGGVNDWKSGGNVTYVWRMAIQSITCVGVDLFVLISGYFSIRPKVKSIVNLYTLLAFFYLAFYCLDCVLGLQILSPKGVVKNLLAFSRENWFIQCYLFLMLLSPMVNKFMDSLTEKEAFFFVGLFMLLAFYFGCVRLSTYFYFNKGYSVTTLLLIYVVGRYLRLYGEKRLSSVSSRSLLCIYVLSVIVVCAIRCCVGDAERWLSYCSPAVIVSSSLMFLLFARMNFQSRVVNWIGVSCLAAFIIHTCSPVIGWMSSLDTRLFLTKPLIVWIISMAGVIAAVFTFSILLDKVRLYISRPVISLAERIDQFISYGNK